MTMEEILVSGLAELGVPATAEQLAQLRQYYALLDERGFRGSAKAGISVFDDDFGLHAQQVAPSACSTNAT